MKQSSTIPALIILVLILGTFISFPAFAATGDTLVVSDSYGLPGQGGYTFTIDLINVTEIKGLYFTLSDFPDSLDVTGIATQARSANFRVDTTQVNGAVKVLMLPNDPAGTLLTTATSGGPILQLTVSVAAGAPGGTTANLTLSNVKMANDANLPVTFAKRNGRFWFGKKLDVIYNGVVDLFDVLRIIDIAIIRGPAPTEYEMWAADWDDDGLITVVDIGEAMDQAVNPTPSPGKDYPGLSKTSGSVRIDIPKLPANFTGKLDLPVKVNSSAPLHGLQMTLDIDGNNYMVEPPKTTAASRGMKVVSKIMNNKLHFIMCGLEGHAVPMGEATVLTIPVNIQKQLSEAKAIKIEKVLAGTQGAAQLQTFYGSGSTDAVIPETFALYQNNPNPFNMNTMITFDVPNIQSGSVPVRLEIYNTRGQLVKRLVDQNKQAGRYTVTWNGSDDFGRLVSSGVYFYRFTAQDIVLNKKLAIMK